jgi:alpha-glucuronidase
MPPEDGYRLWLRYAPPGGAAAAYRQAIGQIVVQGTSATALIIRAEMTAALERVLGAAVPAPGAWGARTRW